MSYTYVAIDSRDGELKAAFHRKHELSRWAFLLDKSEDDPYAVYHMEWFRVRSYPWETESSLSYIPREEILPGLGT